MTTGIIDNKRGLEHDSPSVFSLHMAAAQKNVLEWPLGKWNQRLKPASLSKTICGCGSKLNRRGKPQVLVHVSTYQGSSHVGIPVF